MILAEPKDQAGKQNWSALCWDSPRERKSQAFSKQRLRIEFGRLAAIGDLLDNLRRQEGATNNPAHVAFADLLPLADFDHRRGAARDQIFKPSLRASINQQNARLTWRIVAMNGCILRAL
jgi:hypothetical protein